MGQNFETTISAKAIGTDAALQQAAAIRELAQSVSGLTDASKKVQPPKWQEFAAGVKNFIQNPLDAAGNAAEGLLMKIGPVGAAASVAAVGIGALSKVGFEAMKSLGEFGHEIESAAARMGMTTKEVAQFRFAMKYAGGDMGQLEGIMRKLSQEIDSGGKTLRDLGVSFLDVHTGALRPTSAILMELAERLKAMPDVAARNAAAIKVLGRAALDVLPDLMELPEGLKRAEELQKNYSPQQLARWKDYQHQVAEIESAWESLKRSMKEPLAAVVNWYIQGASGRGNSLGTFASGSRAAALLSHGSYGSSPASGIPGMDAILAFVSGREKRTGDGLIDSLMGVTPEDRLQIAKTKLKDLREELEKFRGVDANAPALTAQAAKVREQSGVVAGIQAEIEAIKEREKLEKSYAAWRVDYYRKLVDPSRWQKAVGELADQAPQLGPLGPTQQALSDAMALVPLSTIPPPPGYISPEQQLRDARHGGTRAMGLFGAQADLAGMDPIERIKRMYGLQIEFADREYAALMRLAQTDIDRLDAEDQRKEKIFQAEMERDRALLEMAQRQKESFRNIMQSAWDAMRSGNFSGFLMSAERGIENRIVGAAADRAWGSVSKLLPHAKAGSFWGDVFSGTPLGPEVKLNTAGDKLILADGALIEAARAQAMSASGGGGGFSSAIPTWRRMAQEIFDGAKEPLPYGADGPPVPPGSNYNYPRPDSGIPWAKLGGYTAAGLGGAFGIYSGLSAGGARGGLTAGGSALASAGSIMALASKTLAWAGPVGMLAGMGLGMLTSLFPNAKQDRARAMEEEAARRAVSLPGGAEYAMDMYGRSLAYDYRGGMRPIIVNNVTNNIEAIDAPSLKTYLKDNPDALSSGIHSAIAGDNGDDVVGVLRERLGLNG